MIAVRAATAGGASLADAEQRNILVGWAALFLMLIPHYEWFGRVAYPALLLVIVLLAAGLLTEPINGSRRWFSIGTTFQIQPSELAKLAFICALAWYLRYRKYFKQLTGLIGPFVLMLVPCFLILIEPDLGTAVLFPLVLYAMLIGAGARLRDLSIMAVLAMVILPGMYPLLRPYQQDRLKSILVQWMHPEDSRYMQAHRQGEGYQQNMSVTAARPAGRRRGMGHRGPI